MMFEERRFEAAADGLVPQRPIRAYPAHAFRYDNHVSDLVDLLAPAWAHGHHFQLTAPRRHNAVDTGDNPVALANFLVGRMAASDLMWAMAPVYASRRPWLKFENGYAEASGLPALAIAPWGQERLSQVATADGTREEVRWQSKSVIDATLRALPESVLNELYPPGLILRHWAGKLARPAFEELQESVRARSPLRRRRFI